jgi:nitrite reductase/ring-hydroxylating ferredoxin subunit
MNDRVEVAQVSSFSPGESRIVETEQGLSIGVFNVEGTYHALLNKCLHQNGPLCEGSLEPEIVGEWPGTGNRVEERYGDDYVVKCPWHGWEYDLETGELNGDDDIAVPVFDVVIEDRTVYVELA